MGDDDDEDNDEQSGAIAAATDAANDIIQDLFQGRAPNPEDECQCDSQQCRELLLSRELDTILSPKIIFRHPNQLDKLWPLLTNRQMTVTSFLESLAEYRADRHCGDVWPPNCVAYRCRTCSDSPTMALCADCFRNGNHAGHNYNMFKSRSGGACDCGFSVLKESGYCRYHGKNTSAKREQEQIPQRLICVPKRSMPRLVHRLAIQLRRSFVELTGELDLYLDYLIQLANSNNIMRSLMIDALTSEKHYFNQLDLFNNHPDKEVSRIISEGLKKLKQEQKGLVPFKVPDDWNPPGIDITAFCDYRPIGCFVDELTFWLVVFEFPQKLICFLLGFLMDDKYKQIFARAFVNQYPRIVMILAGARGESRRPQRDFRDSYEQLFRRVLQISAQIYNDENLTKTLCDEEYTLHTILYCIRAAIEGVPSESMRGVLKYNPLCPFSSSTPKVICFDKLVIRDRHLGSFTEDLNAILCSEHAAKRLLSDEDLLNTWLEMQSYFQTMSPYKRELTEHTPYETGAHVSVFTIESDFCLSPLWSILHHLRDKQSLPYTKSLLRSIHANLSIWFHRMNIGPNSLLDPYHMSFHIPLHRMFSATLRHIIFIQEQPDEDIYTFLSNNQSIFGAKYGYKSAFGTSTVIEINDFFKILLSHPLQALTLYHETRSSMWTRNGLMTINQAVNYVHCAYSYSTIDLDMFLLKYCASKLNPNYFLKIFMSRFHAWKWLSFKSNALMNNASDASRQLYHFNILPEQITLMVESSLSTIIQLITLSIHCNDNERDQIRQEMVTLISVLDRSYSYLVDMLPNRNTLHIRSNTSDETFANLLKELTVYKPAQHGVSNLQQGCYTLKPEVWDSDYDPIAVQYRFYQKRDYQMSLERYFQHAKLTGKLEKRYHSSALWPPLKIPTNIGNFGRFDLSPLIECPSLVGLVFSIIYKNLYIVDVPDAIMAYAIHLLELSLRKCLEKKSQQTTVKTEPNHEPKLNPAFAGKFCFRELTSSPAYFGSKGEAYIKGSTIFSVPDSQNTDSKVINCKETKLFPVVRHALDLAFDTTWFPFDSILENCLVHVENVYSLPWKEFEIVLNCQPDSDEQVEKRMQQASDNSAGLTDAAMSWCDENDEAEDDEFEDGEDEEEEGEDEESSDRAARIDTFDQRQNNSPETDSDSETTGFIPPGDEQSDNQPINVEADLRSANQLRRTQDRATNTQSFWTAAYDHIQTIESNVSSESTTSQNLTRTTNTNTTTQSSSTSQSLCSVFALQPQQMALQAVILRSREWASRHSSQGQESRGIRAEAAQEPLNSEQQQQPADPRSADSQDVEMITVSYEQVAEPASGADDLSCRPGTPIAECTDSSTCQSADERAQTSAVQPSPSTSSQTNSTRLPLVISDDHSYSANTGDTSMEVESSPANEFGPLVLIPYHRVFDDDSAAQEAQMYPENLVTERRAIEASDPRPMMITGSVAPLSLEAPTRRSIPRDRLGLRNLAESHQEQSLSDLDIQTRFMGFFQSRDQIRPNARGFRQRQMARRGGFRGPVPPFAVHNPNSTLSPSRQARLAADFYGRSRQTARRSNASFLSSRSPLSRSQQDQRNKRLRKDRMHHGESLLTLLLRLHAKYGQQGRAFVYSEQRAKSSRSRIGDGAHFVTIVLDLICSLDRAMPAKLEQLQELIWPDKEAADEIVVGARRRQFGQADAGQIGARLRPEPESKWESAEATREERRMPPEGAECNHMGTDMETNSPACGANPTKPLGGSPGPNASCRGEEGGASSSNWPQSAALSPAERRRRAKEFQSKLMADFASKQRAFIERYESSSGQQQTAHSKTTTPNRSDKLGSQAKGRAAEPINLSSKLSQETKPQMSDYDKRGQQQSAASSSGFSCGRLDKDLEVAAESELTAGGSSKPLLANDRKLEREREGGQPESEPGGTCEASGSGSGSATHYECCICGLDGPGDQANPLGQVVLLQSTSVFGHSHLRAQNERRLPCEEAHYLCLKEETYAKYLERRIDLLCEHFSESSWLDSINIGAEGGVHVQSCGHYLHIECHQSYIKSLDQEDRLRSRNDSDEFLCPVCRRLANSVLPILGELRRPERLAVALIDGGKLDDQIALIGQLLEQRLPPNQKELQSSAAFCSHLTKATGPQYRLVRSNANMHSLFLFLTSIARTNLECELIVRSSARASQSRAARPAKQTCFELLFRVLALNAQTLINQQWFTCDQIWSQLTHRNDQKNRLTVKPMNSEVPLLLRDPVSILLQFLFAITSSLCNQANFACLVQVLFNLCALQSAALALSYVGPQRALKDTAEQTSEPSSSAPKDSGSRTADFRRLAGELAAKLGYLLAPTTEEPLMNAAARAGYATLAGQLKLKPAGTALDSAECFAKLACLPYLRAAALLQHHLYRRPFPELALADDQALARPEAIEADFSALLGCLGLGSHSAAGSSLVSALRWPAEAGANGAKLTSCWAAELLRFGLEFSIAARSLLLSRSLVWRRPSLMKLPEAFDDIFMFYYRKKCALCQQVPKDVAVCLVCGAPICFRMSCCKDRTRSRQAHSQHCGANTAIFLAVHTSSVVVIRGSRACVWGSVYLDAHEEEDNGLQRGRPLHLVRERFELLEEQWLTHSFDYTCGKRWIYLQENQ